MWEDERKRLVRVPRRATHGDDDYDDYDDEDDNDEEQGYGGNGRSSSGRGGYSRVGKVVDDEEDDEEGCLWWCCCSCFKWQRVCGVMCGLVILAALLYALLDASDLLPCGDKCLPAMGSLGPLYQRAVNAAQQQMGGAGPALPNTAEGGAGSPGVDAQFATPSAAEAYLQQQASQNDALQYQPEQQQQQQQSMVHFEPRDSALLVPHTQPVEQQQQGQEGQEGRFEYPSIHDNQNHDASMVAQLGPQGQQQQQQQGPELPQEPPLDMPFVPPQKPPLTPPQGPEGGYAPRVDAPTDDQPEWSTMAGQEAEGHVEEAMAEGETGENAENAGQAFTEQAQAEAQQVLAEEAQQQPPAAQWGADSAQGGAGTWGAEGGAGAAEGMRGTAVDGIAEESRGYNTGAGGEEFGAAEGEVQAERQVEAEGLVAAGGQSEAGKQVSPQRQGVAEGTLAQGQENRARTALPSAPVNAAVGEAAGGSAGKVAGSAGQAELQGEVEAGGWAQIPDARTGSGNATGATDVPASASVAGKKAAATSSGSGAGSSTAASGPVSATVAGTFPATTAAAAASATTSATTPTATSATGAASPATTPATAAGASQASAFGHVAGGVQELQAEGEARARAEQQRKKGEGSGGGGGEAQGDEVPDDAMAADFRPCIEPSKLAAMAAQSSWPYLALLGVRPGFTRQQEALLRGLWAAKATGSVLLLPPFFLSFDSGAMKQTKLQQYLDTDRLVTHMYCASKSWAVDQLPASIIASLPANATAGNMPALIQALGPAAQRIPAKVVAALSAGGGSSGGASGAGGPGGDAASVIAAWSEKMRDDAAAGKVKLILLDADTPIPFTSRDQQHLRRNGLAAMRPAQPIASLSAHLLHLLRKTHEAQFGELVGFSFAVRAAILNRLTSASFHITTRDALLRSDRSAASSDAQRLLSALHPEHEMQAAVEQAVAREAAVFFGPAESSFSSLVFELRCFTHPPLLEGGEGVAMRATVFYDVGPSAVPCRA
ncbi:unnamed protein product [Closterium sp. NIES-65]|nr:unnamed protein product [Closterium sp. NIES-65]